MLVQNQMSIQVGTVGSKKLTNTIHQPHEFDFSLEFSILTRESRRLMDNLVNFYMACTQKNKTKARTFAFQCPMLYWDPSHYTMRKISGQNMSNYVKQTQAISTENTFDQPPTDLKTDDTPINCSHQDWVSLTQISRTTQLSLARIAASRNVSLHKGLSLASKFWDSV